MAFDFGTAALGGIGGLALNAAFGGKKRARGGVEYNPYEQERYQEALRDRQSFRDIGAGGGNIVDPYARLSVQDNLSARLGRNQQAAFNQGQQALNATGGATTGQLTHLARQTSQDYLNRLGEVDQAIQFARAQNFADQVGQARGILGSTIGGGAPEQIRTYQPGSPGAFQQLYTALAPGFGQAFGTAAASKLFAQGD